MLNHLLEAMSFSRSFIKNNRKRYQFYFSCRLGLYLKTMLKPDINSESPSKTFEFSKPSVKYFQKHSKNVLTAVL